MWPQCSERTINPSKQNSGGPAVAVRDSGVHAMTEKFGGWLGESLCWQQLRDSPIDRLAVYY